MTVRLGIIGCGDVAFRTYFPWIDALGNRAQVAVCFDPIPERADRAAARFPGARAVTDLAGLLAEPDLDAAINLTPPPYHLSTTSAALDAGLHVLSEKPLAVTLADAQSLIAKADSVGKLLLCAPGVMATHRFRWLKRLLGDGQLGRPLSVTAQMANMGPAEWRGYTGDPAVFYKPGVGPLIDIGVYPLHGMTGLLGPATRVQAMGGILVPQRNVLIDRLAGQTVSVETPDHISLQLEFASGGFGQLLASFAVPRSKAPAFELHATGGSVSIALERWYEGSGPTDVFLRDPSPLGVAGWMENVPLPEAPAAENLIGAGPRHLVGCIEGVETPILTATHAAHVLEIMLAAQTSIAERRPVELTSTF